MAVVAAGGVRPRAERSSRAVRRSDGSVVPARAPRAGARGRCGLRVRAHGSDALVIEEPEATGVRGGPGSWADRRRARPARRPTRATCGSSGSRRSGPPGVWLGFDDNFPLGTQGPEDGDDRATRRARTQESGRGRAADLAGGDARRARGSADRAVRATGGGDDGADRSASGLLAAPDTPGARRRSVPRRDRAEGDGAGSRRPHAAGLHARPGRMDRGRGPLGAPTGLDRLQRRAIAACAGAPAVAFHGHLWFQLSGAREAEPGGGREVVGASAGELDDGFSVPGMGLWLDPRRHVPFAFASDAFGEAYGRGDRDAGDGALPAPAPDQAVVPSLAVPSHVRAGEGDVALWPAGCSPARPSSRCATAAGRCSTSGGSCPSRSGSASRSTRRVRTSWLIDCPVGIAPQACARRADTMTAIRKWAERVLERSEVRRSWRSLWRRRRRSSRSSRRWAPRCACTG